jgi:hypothetical protein
MPDPLWGFKGKNHKILGKTALCKLLMGKIRLRSAIFWDVMQQRLVIPH